MTINEIFKMLKKGKEEGVVTLNSVSMMIDDYSLENEMVKIFYKGYNVVSISLNMIKGDVLIWKNHVWKRYYKVY